MLIFSQRFREKLWIFLNIFPYFFDILDSSIFIVGQSMMNIFTEYENKKKQISEGLWSIVVKMLTLFNRWSELSPDV